jgi:NOL1/NOP2/fmu family ribosome biogenesis protein
MDTNRLAETFPNTFDMIMVDAPCSGEGMFRKEEIAITEWSLENVRKCAERQADILDNAVKCLKNGGYIVYATCTFSLEENEMTVDAFLTRHPEFEIVPVTKRVLENSMRGISFEGCSCEHLEYSARFYPHKNRGEGQFCAVLHHKGETQNYGNIKNSSAEKIDKIVLDFLDDTLTDYDKEKVIMYNGNPVYFTPDFSIKKGAAFSCGVTIGEIKKNYIQPHHQFFMALGKNFKRKIELDVDSPQIIKYLHGEEIEVDCENGWAVVTVCGAPLGGVKVVNGRAKNHYPKGLRLIK